MKHDFLDHHRHGNSLIHRADPRLKLIMMVLYILVLIFLPLNTYKFYLHLGLIVFTLAFLSGISFFHYLSKLMRVYLMVLFIYIFIPFLPLDSDQYYNIGILKIYHSGLEKFIHINIKTSLIMLMSIVLTTTTDFMRLLKGMEKFRIPQVALSILSFMYRFIFLLVDETERMWMAFNSRYIKLTYVNRLKIFAKQLGMLFIRTYERGERVYQAMESRGFHGSVYILNELVWLKRDSIMLIIFLMCLYLPMFLL